MATAWSCSTFVKSVPSTSKILSPGCRQLLAGPFGCTFVTNIPSYNRYANLSPSLILVLINFKFSENTKKKKKKKKKKKN